jgi:hypothetical protein
MSCLFKFPWTWRYHCIGRESEGYDPDFALCSSLFPLCALCATKETDRGTVTPPAPQPYAHVYAHQNTLTYSLARAREWAWAPIQKMVGYVRYSNNQPDVLRATPDFIGLRFDI